jgi:circadian clock protein KaiB
MPPERGDTPLTGADNTRDDALGNGSGDTPRGVDPVTNADKPTYVFRLFVSGTSQRSAIAITTVRKLCEEYLARRYELEVVDVYQQPGAAKSAKVIAIPTLIKESPAPTQRVVGDMSSADNILTKIKLESEVERGACLDTER